MQMSDLSADQQQQLAMQEGATTPEDMVMVLKMLSEDPENFARALGMMGLNVTPEQVTQAAAWMDERAGASAGMPPSGEQAGDVASAAAGVDDSGSPPDTAPAATVNEGIDAGAEPMSDEQAPPDEAAPAPMPQGAPPMPQRGAPPQDMDSIISASLMQGAQAPPQIRGGRNINAPVKGPATPKRGSSGGDDQQQRIMALMEGKGKKSKRA